MFTKFWNAFLGLESPPVPADLRIIIEPSRRDLWRFRLVNQETGKTVMVSAGRGKKTFEEALQAAQAVADANIVSVLGWGSDTFGVPGPPITTPDLRPITTPDPPVTETEPTITETEPVKTATTVGFGTYDPAEARRAKIWEKALQRNETQDTFSKEKPYHYKQTVIVENGETKMKI